MRAETLLGLAKLLEKQAKAARDSVEAGEHDIDETVMLHVFGTLNVADDQTYAPTVKMPWKTVLALFVRSCGATREAALAMLEAAMHAALLQGEDAAELIAASADLDEAEVRVQEALDALPPQVRRGAVNTSELTYVEARPAKTRRAA